MTGAHEVLISNVDRLTGVNGHLIVTSMTVDACQRELGMGVGDALVARETRATNRRRLFLDHFATARGESDPEGTRAGHPEVLTTVKTSSDAANSRALAFQQIHDSSRPMTVIALFANSVNGPRPHCAAPHRRLTSRWCRRGAQRNTADKQKPTPSGVGLESQLKRAPTFRGTWPASSECC